MFNSDFERKTNPKEFSGFYRGEVVDVNDPLRAGRVRVRVFGVFDDFQVNTIPWSIYADPFMGGNSNRGGFFVPDMGNHVWVFFEQGDPEQPVYFAGAPSAIDGPTQRNSGSYPSNRVFSTNAGHYVEIDDSAGATRIVIHHQSGTEVMIDHGGNMTITVVGDLNRTVNGNYFETINGDYETTVAGRRTEQSGGGSEYLSGGEIDISGSRVNINE